MIHLPDHRYLQRKKNISFATTNPANPHIGHDALEFSNVLKFAEEVFGLP